ncbi:MAG: methyl-accepting chemotaxis protein [Myxococcota bacterium]
MVAVPLVLPIIFNVWYVPGEHGDALTGTVREKAKVLTRLYADNAAAPISFDDSKGLDLLLKTAQADSDIKYMVVTSADGKELGVYGDRSKATKRWKPSELEADTVQIWEAEGQQLLHAAFPVVPSRELIGAKGEQELLGVVQAGFDTAPMTEQASKFRNTAIGIFVVVLLIAAAMAFLLGRSFAELFERLRQSMLQTASRVDDVVNQLAAVTAEQTSAASEESAALNESSATASDLAHAATAAAQRAGGLIEGGSRAEKSAADGLKAVDTAIGALRNVREQMNTLGSTVGALSERAAAIGEIASTVALLAERSNLLALNAAIEAARAGTQGRGFSVVAQEMRSLADGSNRSAGQVKAIIGEIQASIARAVNDSREGERRVGHAEQLAEQAGDSIKRFAEVTREFALVGKEIAASSNQQSVAIEQMVESISHAAQAGNSQLTTTKQVEETSRQLRELSRAMLKTVIGEHTDNRLQGSAGLGERPVPPDARPR